MAVPFSRSLRSLETDGRAARRAAALVAIALLAVWSAWFLGADVAVIEVADVARVEADRLAHHAEALVGGRVVENRLGLGRVVEAGEVLVELDARADAAELAEKRALVASVTSEIAPLEGQIASQRRVLAAQRDVARSSVEEARVRHRDAEVTAVYSATEADRAAQLRAQGLASDADAARARSTADSRRADAKALLVAIDRVASQQRAREGELAAEIGRLEREREALIGQRARALATVGGLELRVDQHRIRAPVSGRLGDIAPIQVGSVLRAGDTIARVVPEATLRAVAEFPAARAVGRVRAGQPARLRLHGFPWTQWGVLRARVVSVANEARDARVRVELSLVPDPSVAIPVQHGLEGTAEVEVERVSPAVLALRAAGSFLRRPVAPDGARPAPSTVTPVAGAAP